MDNLADDLKELDVFIGKRLREKRHKLGLTLVQVGKDVGMSHQQIQKYEQAQSRVSAGVLYQLGQFYGISPHYFYQGFTPPHQRSEKKKGNAVFHNPAKVLHILLVEDNPADELLMRRSLDASNHKINVFCVHDGAQTIDFLRYKQDLDVDFPRPDLILLNLNIPKRDGFNVLKEIKRDRLLQDIPVIALTNGISVEEMVNVYQNYAAGYVCKTFDHALFQANIVTLINYWSSVAVLPGTTQDQDEMVEEEEEEFFLLETTESQQEEQSITKTSLKFQTLASVRKKN